MLDLVERIHASAPGAADDYIRSAEAALNGRFPQQYRELVALTNAPKVGEWLFSRSRIQRELQRRGMMSLTKTSTRNRGGSVFPRILWPSRRTPPVTVSASDSLTVRWQSMCTSAIRNQGTYVCLPETSGRLSCYSWRSRWWAGRRTDLLKHQQETWRTDLPSING